MVVSPFPQADLFSITYIRCSVQPGLPFFHKAPVIKLIYIIIERRFNEGKMFLTFECHILLLSYDSSEISPLHQAGYWFYDNGFPKI